jgi:hypothetical protein
VLHPRIWFQHTTHCWDLRWHREEILRSPEKNTA